jgi:hypothetical protein
MKNIKDYINIKKKNNYFLKKKFSKKYIYKILKYRKIYFYKNIKKNYKNILYEKIIKIKLLKKKNFNTFIINKKIIIKNYNKKKVRKKNTEMVTYNVKFCVFLGREKNMKILHNYVELCLQNSIFNEYHMYDFSRNINDHNFIKSEYNRLNLIFNSKIFLHNFNENKFEKIKTDWNPFYKELYQNTNENDVIIKCDDDILFIDIYSLKNAINDRIKDKKSFLIHSNCINNGVCTYYQKDIYPKIKDKLNIYPTGGIMGILFEKPEIAYAIHNQFTNDLLIDLENLSKYIIDDICINTRISINFILINGIDTKYFKNITYNDEYELSSFLPEKLGRYNKIKGDLITSHLSYSFQEKIILNKDYILNDYKKLMEKFIIIDKPIIKKYNMNEKLYIPMPHIRNGIYKIKNWLTSNHYYIKNADSAKYLYIEYENDEIAISDNKSIFEIIVKSNNLIEIKLGIYYLTRYNAMGKFTNEKLLFKYIWDEKGREILKENIDNSFYLKFTKYNYYLNDVSSINISQNKLTKWIFEKVNYEDEFIYCKRIIKNEKIYYKNIKNNEIYTNFYKGWGQENVIW